MALAAPPSLLHIHEYCNANVHHTENVITFDIIHVHGNMFTCMCVCVFVAQANIIMTQRKPLTSTILAYFIVIWHDSKFSIEILLRSFGYCAELRLCPYNTIQYNTCYSVIMVFTFTAILGYTDIDINVWTYEDRL